MNYQLKKVNSLNAPEADQHFKLPNHNFIQHAIFTFTEQQDNVNIDKDLATFQKKKHENHRIPKLKLLYP